MRTTKLALPGSKAAVASWDMTPFVANLGCRNWRCSDDHDRFAPAIEEALAHIAFLNSFLRSSLVVAAVNLPWNCCAWPVLVARAVCHTAFSSVKAVK